MTMTNTQVNNLLEDIDDASQTSAFLSASADTTTTVAMDWYAVGGAFTNDFTNFELDTDKIKYIGSNTYEFEIDMHAKFTSDIASTTSNISLAKNGVACEDCKMGSFIKFAGEPINVSSTHIVELATNDTLQIVVQSDKTGAVLTFGQFVLTCTKYTLPRIA